MLAETTTTTGAAFDKDALEGFPSEEELAAKCLELGLVMRQPHTHHISHPALSLRPFPMKAEVLQQLYDLQLLWNEAINRTARNFEFLYCSMKSTAESDLEFTGRLLAILKKVYMTSPVEAKAPVYQPIMLGILRTDYMSSVDQDSGSHTPSAEVGAMASTEAARQWKNIEINTISCSFAGVSPLVQRFHAYLHKFREALMNVDASVAVEGARAMSSTTSSVATASPRQREPSYVIDEKYNSAVQVPAALAKSVDAWRDAVPYSSFLRQYQQRTGVVLKPIVLAVVQENECNAADQYKLLLELLETHGVLSLRRTLAEMHETMRLEHVTLCDNNHDCSTETKEVLSDPMQPPFAVVDEKYVVAVAYFRSTYVPKDLPTEAAWQTRERIEQSNAVKCPSIPYHLMTFKKMQQLMSNVSEVLAPVSFAGDQKKAAALAEHFIPQYSLNKDEYAQSAESWHYSDDGKVINDPEYWIADAVLHPERYVLKPQLEGGGNLIAGEPMQRLLRDATHDDPLYKKIRREYILMRRIQHPVSTGIFFQQHKIHVHKHNACSEVGIFGLSCHLMRTGTS
ncbi:glutathione synthetase, putative [Leishmania tarentolae]|uniref:Glutathione synthetase n=1 Tax=Leishmania tarentolae TaxID=5689 RepID=A0A640KBR3_LEITA|nr:glutathione synthetase, putative [Leishmania tarentolae]